MANELREAIASRAGSRCEYCRMHQSLQGATFHIEHVVPRSLGGSSDLANLALACPSCNLHKADLIAVEVPWADEPIQLFNPRTDCWGDHFAWDKYHIVAATGVGTATIATLDLNHPRRVRIRQAEQLFGLFPPQES